MTINTINTNPAHLKECLTDVITDPILYKKAQFIWGKPGCGYITSCFP